MLFWHTGELRSAYKTPDASDLERREAVAAGRDRGEATCSAAPAEDLGGDVKAFYLL